MIFLVNSPLLLYIYVSLPTHHNICIYKRLYLCVCIYNRVKQFNSLKELVKSMHINYKIILYIMGLYWLVVKIYTINQINYFYLQYIIHFYKTLNCHKQSKNELLLTYYSSPLASEKIYKRKHKTNTASLLHPQTHHTTIRQWFSSYHLLWTSKIILVTQ